MTKIEAADLLNLPQSADAVQVSARYRELYSDFQIRLSNAPTPSLKKAYQRNLEELRSASELLCPGVLQETTDLPAAQPVRGVELAPARGGLECAQTRQGTVQKSGLSRGVLVTGAVAVAFAALASFLAVRQFSESGPLVASQAGPASLLVMTDLACGWKLDGALQRGIAAGQAVRVSVGLGKHLINATTTDGLDTIETMVEASRPQQEVVRLALNTVRADRLQAEAAAQVERQREASAAEAERRQCGGATSGCWFDARTQLMWSRHDNGLDIDWAGAVSYCRNLSLGGVRNWRLPEIGELAQIYDPNQADNVKGGIQPTTNLYWSATDHARFSGEVWMFYFGDGSRDVYEAGDSISSRALCVRRARE